jgi:uncharacterized protein (UPF0335 family)
MPRKAKVSSDVSPPKLKRGRPKKDAAPPPAKGSVPGDNGGENGISDAKMGDLFVRELTKLEAILAKMETLKADARNQRKRMKSDGFETYEVNYALKLRKADDDEMLEQRRREARIARWLAHPVGTQSDFLADLTHKLANGSDPEGLGRIAGAEGAVCKPPANLNQDDAQRWITGWHKGQDAMASAGIKAPEAEPDF